MNIIKDIFKNIKIWEEYLPNYKIRDSQIELAEKIYDALLNNSVLIGEAGTGIGKTLAYLVPIFLYLGKNKNLLEDQDFRILISTETKTLQNQIYYKDIPLLQKVMNIKKIPTALCFGSNNYVCLFKMNEYLEKNPKLKKDLKIQNFINWLSKNESGRILDYTEDLEDEFIKNIVREPEDCLSNKCPNFSISYYFLEKEKWKRSKILITNHHLFSTHLIKNNILPKFQIAILDESHFFPEIYRENNQNIFSLRNVIYILKKLKFEKEKINILEAFYENLNKFLEKKIDFEQENKIKIPKSFELANYFECINILTKAKEELEKKLHQAKGLFSENSVIKKTQEEIEYEKNVEKLNQAILILNQFYDGPKKNTFHYIEKTQNDIKFCISPVYVNTEIRENLIYQMDSTIFLSATLSVNEQFEFFLNKIGLEKNDVETIVVSTPFNLKKQALLYIPQIIEPNNYNNEEYINQCSEEIYKLLNLIEGRTLILFTSKKNLIQIHKKLLENYYSFFKDQKMIFSQEELGPQISLKEFLKNENSILLGLDSFRQGIDLSYHKLRSVILVKLPFSVPTDPLISTLMENTHENGYNGFINILFPEMIIKLKQGMGRLIRNEEDFGVITILDSRIYTKSYGKIILENLSKYKIFKDFDQLRIEYQKFYKFL